MGPAARKKEAPPPPFGSVRMQMLRKLPVACSIVLSAHQVILPPGSARSDPQVPPREGLTPHTIHHCPFGLLQAPLPLVVYGERAREEDKTNPTRTGIFLKKYKYIKVSIRYSKTTNFKILVLLFPPICIHTRALFIAGTARTAFGPPPSSGYPRGHASSMPPLVPRRSHTH